MYLPIDLREHDDISVFGKKRVSNSLHICGTFMRSIVDVTWMWRADVDNPNPFAQLTVHPDMSVECTWVLV
jgi:hypothetical protein